MVPTREEAHRILEEAEPHNPGPWVKHCITAAHCAEKIAAACGMDADKAYVLGLLHDIGRRYGSYPQDKWDANIGLRAYFEEKAGGKNIYELVEKDMFRP